MHEGRRTPKPTHPTPPDFGPGDEPFGPPDDEFYNQANVRDPRKTAAIAAGTGLAGTGYLYGRGISFPDALMKKHEPGLRRLVQQRGIWGNIKAGARETPKDIGRLVGAGHRSLSTAIFNRINKMATKDDNLIQFAYGDRIRNKMLADLPGNTPWQTEELVQKRLAHRKGLANQLREGRKLVQSSRRFLEEQGWPRHWKLSARNIPKYMSSKHDRLVNLNSRLERIINFDDDDDSHLLRNTALVGGAGVAGAGGLYAAGALKAGVKPSNLAGNLAANFRKRGFAGGAGLAGSRIAAGGRSTWDLIRRGARNVAGLVRE